MKDSAHGNLSKCVDTCPFGYDYVFGKVCMKSCGYRIDGKAECLSKEDSCSSNNCSAKCQSSHLYEIDLGNNSYLCVENCSAHTPAMYLD